MATVIEGDDIGEIEAVEEQAIQAPVEQVPEKYRGKEPGDLIRMHQEAEKLIGRQAQEVGEVRKLADELLKSQLRPKAEAEKPVEIDFFENPKEAIRQAVDNNPKVIAAEQHGLNMARVQAQQLLDQVHPDAKAITQDAEFIDWVKNSPIRTKLFQMADNYDVDAAHELLGTFKQLKQTQQVTQQRDHSLARSDAIRAVSVDAGGAGESSRKVYRRADLIRLKMSDPDKYDAMSDEITIAYSEDRVR